MPEGHKACTDKAKKCVVHVRVGRGAKGREAIWQAMDTGLSAATGAGCAPNRSDTGDTMA